MNDPFATQKDTTFRQPNASEVEDFKAMTGWDTPAEMAAYEKGREHEEELMIRFIAAWDGETNSGFGRILADKFKEISGKNLNFEI